MGSYCKKGLKNMNSKTLSCDILLLKCKKFEFLKINIIIIFW